MQSVASANRLIAFSPIYDSNYFHVVPHNFLNASFSEIQELLIKNIIFSKSINSFFEYSSEKALLENKFYRLVNKAKNTYSEIYKKDYKNLEAYSSFLSEIRTLVMNNNAELRFYDNSVRFDFTKGNNIFIIEYSREDDFLTITKKSEKNLVMKECVLGEINQVLNSFGE